MDEVICLDADPSAARTRAIGRDPAQACGPEATAVAYDTRYGAACALSLDDENPR